MPHSRSPRATAAIACAMSLASIARTAAAAHFESFRFVMGRMLNFFAQKNESCRLIKHAGA